MLCGMKMDWVRSVAVFVWQLTCTVEALHSRSDQFVSCDADPYTASFRAGNVGLLSQITVQ